MTCDGCSDESQGTRTKTNIDIEGRKIKLTNAKSGKDYVVRLHPAAVEILEALPRALGNPFVFPSPTEPRECMKDVKRSWKRIRANVAVDLWMVANPERLEEIRQTTADDDLRDTILHEITTAGQQWDVRLHDLRRTLGSWSAINGVSLQVIGKMLGHGRGSDATEVYARISEDATTGAFNQHGDRLLMAMNGRKWAEAVTVGDNRETGAGCGSAINTEPPIRVSAAHTLKSVVPGLVARHRPTVRRYGAEREHR